VDMLKVVTILKQTKVEWIALRFRKGGLAFTNGVVEEVLLAVNQGIIQGTPEEMIAYSDLFSQRWFDVIAGGLFVNDHFSRLFVRGALWERKRLGA